MLDSIPENIQSLVRSYDKQLQRCPWCKTEVHFQLYITTTVPEVELPPRNSYVLPTNRLPICRLAIEHPRSYILGKCSVLEKQVDATLVFDETFMTYLLERCVFEWNSNKLPGN